MRPLGAGARAPSPALGACGGGGGGTTSIFTTPQAATGAVSGTVLNANTGAPVAGATVQSGGLSSTSGSNGKFTLNELSPARRVVLKLSAPHYAEHLVVTRVVSNRTSSVSQSTQCRVTVTPVNTWSATQPTMPAMAGAVTYCTAP